MGYMRILRYSQPGEKRLLGVQISTGCDTLPKDLSSYYSHSTVAGGFAVMS